MSAWTPTRLCSAHGCGQPATMRGRCQQHQRAEYRRVERYRGTAKSRGYDADWRRVRDQALQRDRFLCRACVDAGRVSAATEVDHITPLSQGGARLLLSNLQSLCRQCHAEKTAREHAERSTHGR